jgi:peptide/nickel transport system ATP-binding protein
MNTAASLGEKESFAMNTSAPSDEETGMQNNRPVPLVKVEGLTMCFPVGGGLFRRPKSFIHAVENVGFEIQAGQSLALVGESGCGKTTTGKLLVRLFKPTSGHIYMFKTGGILQDVAEIKNGEMKEFRHRVQMVFQDPYESLNPRLNVFDAIAEPLLVQGIGSLTEREERVSLLLEQVDLAPAKSFLFRYPHELSGGQRQRVAIARALVVNPEFIVADEPTSMLDVSVRTGVINLMMGLAEQLGISYLYITHDLAVARYTSQEIAVMYMGKIVEQGQSEAVLQEPLHPYTRALISAVPVPDPSIRRQAPEIKGSISQPIDPPPYCRFYPRCPQAVESCKSQPHPNLEDKGRGHFAACYRI